jgi:hypothetical protein
MNKAILEKAEEIIIAAAFVLGILFMVVHWR